jgi:peptidoglycan/LPS O-acetylase OafA/YrhL
VVTYHAGYLTAGWGGYRLLPGGFIGVDLFFVLSGFLITSLLVAEEDRTGGIDLGRFAVRRIRRLFPALLVATVATLVVMGAWRDLPHGGEIAGIAGGTLLYLSNWQQARNWIFVPELSHTWSLAIEAQFYVVWPFVLLAFRRLRVPRVGQAAVLVALMVAVWVHRAAMWTDQAHYLPLYLRTDTRIDVILAGCLLGLATAWGWVGPAWGRALRIPAVLGLVVLAVVCLGSETGDVHLYRDYGLVAVTLGCTAIVASTLLDPTWVLTRAFAWPPLAWLGDRSYSLYLWHVPVFLTVARNAGTWPVAAKLAIGLVVAFTLTELSYRFVETRFRARPGTDAAAPDPVGRTAVG